jgi:hypothetical protein
VAAVAQFQDEPMDACLEEQMEQSRGSENPGWMDAVVVRDPVPSVAAVPVGHTAGLVVQLEVRLESGGRAAPCPEQFAAWFFAAHAAAPLFELEAQAALPARFVSAEE